MQANFILRSNQNGQFKSQSPRGMPIKHVTLTQKRMTDKFTHPNATSPRLSILHQKKRVGGGTYSNLHGAEVQQLKNGNTSDEFVEEAYHNNQRIPRVNTLAKVRVKVKNQYTNDSYVNETSANQSTSYGGWPSPRQTSGKQRTVSLQQQLTKDGRNRVKSSNKRNDSLRVQSGQQRPAFRSFNKGAKAMTRAIQNSKVAMKHVQVPLHIFSSNEGIIIPKKNYKEDAVTVPYSSNQNIFVQGQQPTNNQSILNTQNLISQDISLQTLPHYDDSRNEDSTQLHRYMPELQQQLHTHQTSGANVQIEGDDRNGIQYLMAPPISQLGGTNNSLLKDQTKITNGQLQGSMSWNMQASSPVNLAEQKKKQALQEKLSKHIGSQTFAHKQFHENSGVHFVSNENIQSAGDEDPDSLQVNSQEQNFNTTGKSIFDHTPLQEMPSVKPTSKGGTLIPRLDTQQLNRYTDQPILPPQINPAAGIGFVNYVNGVPVSIQLNKNDLLSQNGPIAKFPQTSINKNHPNNNKLNVQNQNVRLHVKSDLDKKIHAFNNNLYLQKQITQNLVEVQAKQGQYLPVIDTTGMVQAKPFMPTNVRPDFYRTKRKMQNLTVLKGIYDDGFQGNRKSQILEHESFPVQNPLRNSMESPENQVFSGLNHNEQAASFSLKRSLKKRKAFPPKESFSNKKQLKDHLEEFMENKKKSEKHHSTSMNMKSPILDSARLSTSSKIPINIEHKDIPIKMQTAKAGSRQQHYTTSAVTKVVGTSQALKRNPNASRNKQNKTQVDEQDQQKMYNTNNDIYGAPISLDFNTQSGYRPSETQNNRKSAIGKRTGGAKSRRKSPIRVQGHQEQKQQNGSDQVPNVYPFNHSDTFQKTPFEASLFKMKVPRHDMEHLIRDDLDEMSKLEVIYKILKNQLRQHQKTLIKLREEENKRKKKAKEEAEAAGNTGRSLSFDRDKDTVELKEFAKYMKPFELYGPQRDLSPELKRIVRNLTCQEHHYVYCPRCKKYEETDADPMANIKKFLKHIKEEQKRLDQEDPFKVNKQKKAKKKQEKPLPDDSVSDITDLEEDEILAKYFKKKGSKLKATKLEKAEQRKSAQQRLLGEQVSSNRHICRDHRVQTEEEKQQAALDDTVVLELRKPDKPVNMHDEDLSAHQFSVREQSIQADSEERLDIEMQASRIEDRQTRKASFTQTPSKGTKDRLGLRESFEMISSGRKDRSHTQKKGRLVTASQFSSSPVRSINLSPVKNTPKKRDGKLRDEHTLFKPKSMKSEMAIQTESGVHESRRGIKFQDNENSYDDMDDPYQDKFKHLDNYREDWVDSIVYKKAMKAEAIKRGLPYEEYEVDEDEEAYEMQTHFDKEEVGDLNQDQHTKSHHNIGFLKNFNEKGNIQMLKESEVTYLKTLLKKDAEKWEQVQNLADIYRHCKFTIRMLTRKMARVDNKHVFRKNKITNQQNTLTMIYRAEVLYSAKGDANKIFQNMSKYIFDYGEFERIQQLEKVEEPQEYRFIKHREILVRRLLSQINNFLSQYRLFNDSFTFKQVNMNEYLNSELEKVSTVKQWIDGQNNASFLGISHKVDEKKKQIVNPMKIRKVTPFNGQKQSPRVNDIDGISEKNTKKQNNTEALISARSKKSKAENREANKSVSARSKTDKDKKPKITFSLEMNKTIE